MLCEKLMMCLQNYRPMYVCAVCAGDQKKKKITGKKVTKKGHRTKHVGKVSCLNYLFCLLK